MANVTLTLNDRDARIIMRSLMEVENRLRNECRGRVGGWSTWAEQGMDRAKKIRAIRKAISAQRKEPPISRDVVIAAQLDAAYRKAMAGY